MNAGVVEEAEQQLESIDGPGRRLQQARLARKLDLSRAAAQLHLNVQTVEALERDDYTRLPDPVFVRGYIGNYARLVGLPPEQVTAAYNARLPQGGQAVQALGRVRMKDGIGASHRPGRTLALLLIVGLGVLAAFFVKSRLDAPQSSDANRVAEAPEPGLSVEPVADPSVTLKAPAAADNSEQPTSESLDLVAAARAQAAGESAEATSSRAQEGPVRDELAVAEPPWPASAVEPAPVEAEPPGSAGAQPDLILELLGPCWVDIRDANGENKIIGELEKGVQKVIRGEPPFSVVLGNSRAVRLLVNGKPYDVGRHAQGNVARFKLDPRE
jgi:cytoskeleton protein RodZ